MKIPLIRRPQEPTKNTTNQKTQEPSKKPTKTTTDWKTQEPTKNTTDQKTQELTKKPTKNTTDKKTQEPTKKPTKDTTDTSTQETNPSPQTARVSSLTSPHEPQLILTGTYYNHPARILIDCGATGDFISHDYVSTHKIPTSSRTPLEITLADGETQETCTSRTKPFKLRIGPYSIKTCFDLTTLNSDYDIILGMPWLAEDNPHIDWKKCQLTIHQGSHSI